MTVAPFSVLQGVPRQCQLVREWIAHASRYLRARFVLKRPFFALLLGRPFAGCQPLAYRFSAMICLTMLTKDKGGCRRAVLSDVLFVLHVLDNPFEAPKKIPPHDIRCICCSRLRGHCRFCILYLP